MTKSELRKIYLERRRSLSVEEIADKSRQIADRFFESVDLTRIKALHCFIPIAKFNEIDTSWIYKKIWKDFPVIKTAAPRVNFETGEMENIVFRPETQLVENTWGFLEPAGNERVNDAEFDMVLVPLLCFDSRGYRVGYGKGFYDKFLSKCRPDCTKIGLSYFEPAEEISDVSNFDIRLNMCVTPDHIYRFNN